MLNPLNPLSKHLLDSTLEETERLTEALPSLPLDEGTALRLQHRVLDAARQNKAAEKRSARATKGKANTRRKPHSRALPWLAAAACLLLVIGGVLSVPGVAKALRDLIYPEYRGASGYLTEQPEDRTPVADIAETLSAAAPQDVSYKIELLGEYAGDLTPCDEEYNTSIAELRAEQGFPAFDKEAFSFLRDIRPEVREVLYDGEETIPTEPGEYPVTPVLRLDDETTIEFEIGMLVLPESTAAAPLYRVKDADGRNLRYTSERRSGVLTVTADADFAVLTGKFSGLSTLKAQGVKTIVFVTKGATSIFALTDLLEKGRSGETYCLTHDGHTVTFTLGKNMTDVSEILKKE